MIWRVTWTDTAEDGTPDHREERLSYYEASVLAVYARHYGGQDVRMGQVRTPSTPKIAPVPVLRVAGGTG